MQMISAFYLFLSSFFCILFRVTEEEAIQSVCTLSKFAIIKHDSLCLLHLTINALDQCRHSNHENFEVFIYFLSICTSISKVYQKLCHL